MKGLLMLVALGAGAYYVATQSGFFENEQSEAVLAYKSFMDDYIIRRYDAARPLATGSAAEQLDGESDRTSMEFMGPTIDKPLAEKGIVEASKVKVVDERVEGDGLHLQLVYSASISWPGSTANRMSPGSWQRWYQTARMTNTSGEWKVARFTSERQVN